MGRSWLIPISLALLALILWLSSFLYPSIHLTRVIFTLIIILIIYIIFKLILEDNFISKVSSLERRYYLSKTFYFAHLLITFIAIWIIWVEDIQTLLLGFGLVAAAFTISIQDVAKNFVGGLAIYFSNLYRVGDRIEIKEKKGDVIDINLFYTTIMEMREWVSSDQHTGRISSLPNALVLSNPVNNYTKDFTFLWDEVIIPISYGSDWRRAKSLIMDVISQETNMVKDIAEEEISNMERKYYISKGLTDPEVFLKLTDNWIELTARYVTPVRQRRMTRDRVSHKILEEIEKSEGIKIASQTMDIVGFPEIGLETGTRDK